MRNFNKIFQDKHWLTVSNIVTTLRIFLAPVVVLGMYHRCWAFSFFIFVFGAFFVVAIISFAGSLSTFELRGIFKLLSTTIFIGSLPSFCQEPDLPHDALGSHSHQNNQDQAVQHHAVGAVFP